MAMLAKTTYPSTLGSTPTMVATDYSSGLPTSRRIPAMAGNAHGFSSPTESEFSDSDGPDSVKNWDEDRVCDYLASVKCGEYEKLFRKNHINGENLLEMDKEVLKEMGIDKVGDRVRLFLSIKKLRTKAYANQKKRNRVSFISSTQYPSGREGRNANNWFLFLPSGLVCRTGYSPHACARQLSHGLQRTIRTYFVSQQALLETGRHVWRRRLRPRKT